MALEFETLIGGHGGIGTKASASEELAFLMDLRREAVDAMAAHEVDFYQWTTFQEGNVPAVMWDVIDAMKPKRGEVRGFDEFILPDIQ